MPTLGRSRATIVAVAGSAAILMSVVPVTSAREPQWLPELRLSSELQAPDLAVGILRDRAGHPVGGRITVIAWPTSKVLASLPDGASVKTTPVAKAISGPDGRFALRADPSAPIKQFMDESGYVNFDAVGLAPDGSRAVFSFPRRYDAKAGSWANPIRPSAQGGLEITLSANVVPIQGETTEAPMPASDKLGNCGSDIVATYNDRKGLVGEVYTGPHATGDFTYISGSSSTLGVGVSAGGGFGTYSASGTLVASSTPGINYPTVYANGLKVFQSSWQYRKFRIYKFDWINLVCVTDYYKVMETAWWGSSYSYNAASAPTATNCSNQLAGASMWKDSGTAVTFSNGVDLNVGAVGFYASTGTGFNNNTKIYWHFASAGQLCGSNTSWPTAARVVGK
jgi:hypothetical protein